MRVGTLLLLGCLLRDLAASAAPAGPFKNPSGYIAARNVFGLRPPSPRTPLSPPKPVPEVVLTGITTILPQKLALLEVTLPPKPRQPKKTHSYILAEGERDGPVQVLEINAKTGSVRADIFGKIMLLTFEKNGPHSTKAPRPAVSAAGIPRPFPLYTRR